MLSQGGRHGYDACQEANLRLTAGCNIRPVYSGGFPVVCHVFRVPSGGRARPGLTPLRAGMTIVIPPPAVPEDSPPHAR
jgi:hypothetical protein